MSQGPQIVDLGKGPQLAGSRVTVMFLVQFFRRGYSYADIREISPSLTDADVAALEAVYLADKAAWNAKDDVYEEWQAEQIRKQHERFPPFQGTAEEYRAHLLHRLERHKAERNGVHTAG